MPHQTTITDRLTLHLCSSGETEPRKTKHTIKITEHDIVLFI